MQTVQENLADILGLFRKEHAEFPETIKLLGSYFHTLSTGEHAEYFATLWSHYTSEPIGTPRAVHALIVRTWSAFGPTDDLAANIFSGVEWDNSASAESWAIHVGSEFVHSLWEYRPRFSESALNRIKAQCALFADMSAPARLIELAKRLDRGVEKIKLERRAAEYQKVAGTTQKMCSLLKPMVASHRTRHRRSTTQSTIHPHPLATQRRAATVARLIGELNTLKPELSTEEDYNRLSKRFPNYLCFRIARKQDSLRMKLENIQDHRQHIRLAQEMAAAKHGVTLSTVETDWKKHKPPEFRRKR